MNLVGNFTYNCAEKGEWQGRTFFNVGLLSGIENLRCSCSQELFDKVLPGIKQYTECKCTFDFRPNYNTLRLVDIRPVQSNK